MRPYVYIPLWPAWGRQSAQESRGTAAASVPGMQRLRRGACPLRALGSILASSGDLQEDPHAVPAPRIRMALRNCSMPGDLSPARAAPTRAGEKNAAGVFRRWRREGAAGRERGPLPPRLCPRSTAQRQRAARQRPAHAFCVRETRTRPGSARPRFIRAPGLLFARFWPRNFSGPCVRKVPRPAVSGPTLRD